MNAQSVTISGHEIGLPMLIHVSRVHSQIASRVTWHSHTGFELLFLVDGATAYEFADHAVVDLHGGHFLVVPPDLAHRGLQDVRSPSTICGLALQASRASAWRTTTFSAADVRRVRTALESGSRKVHPFNPALRWLVRRLMDQTASFPANPQRAEAGLALRALICAVLVEAMRQMLVPPTGPKQFVAAAVAYLQQHLHEPVRMADLVRHVGFSRARMFDMFKAETGLTPHDYLQRLRIEKAQEQLRQTKLSVTNIALTLGFSSAQYFSTVFARYSGVSPTGFRKGAKGIKPSPLPNTAQRTTTDGHR